MTTSSGLSKPNMYKISRGRTLNGEPNPIDVYIGQRIRVRRQLLGLSQEALAKKIGITFQQVQKYENGINRISASRLWDISKLLKVQVEYFFDGMNESIQAQSPRSLRKNTIRSRQEIGESFDDPMLRQESIRLIKAYSRINNEKLCRKLLDLMIEMSLPK